MYDLFVCKDVVSMLGSSSSPLLGLVCAQVAFASASSVKLMGDGSAIEFRADSGTLDLSVTADYLKGLDGQLSSMSATLSTLSSTVATLSSTVTTLKNRLDQVKPSDGVNTLDVGNGPFQAYAFSRCHAF